jgi:TonB-linked SusC/RagA family outer membrane protein
MAVVCLFHCLNATAQEKTISGTVLSDDDGQPLPGVTVTNSATSKRTQTNQAGYFTLAAEKGHKIVFTYVGYVAQNLVASDDKTISIRLVSNSKEMDNVVVTGYGQARNKKELGYQTVVVKGEDVAQTRRDNFLNALAGRVPGITVTSTSGVPGASAQIMLRGGVSIGGNNQPLFVVDGVPMDNSSVDQDNLLGASSSISLANRNQDYTNRISDLNPEDIETITILKGPEATSLYGSDGAAGAIVITTKKGKGGQTKINYTNSFTLSEVYRYPQVQTTYNRGNNGITDLTAYNSVNAAYALGFPHFGSKYAEGTVIYDNMRNFFQKSFTNQHNLSLEAGTADFNYRMSVGYLDANGIVPNTSYDKANVRFSANAKLNKMMNVSSTWSYVYSTNRKPVKGQGNFYMNLLSFPRDIDIREYQNPDGTRKLIRGLQLTDEIDNPFWEAHKNYAIDKNDRWTGNTNFTYNILKGLSFNAILALDQYTTQGIMFYNPQSRAAASLGGFLSTFEQVYRGLNGTARLTYRKTIADKFSNDFYAGSYIENNNSSLNAQRGERFLEPDHASINNTDPTSRDARLQQFQVRKVRFYGGYTFGYDNLAYITLTGTREGVSTLTSKYKDKQPFFNYASISGSFILSDLKFMKPLTWISYAKLRTSYASTGKGPIRPYIIDWTFNPQGTTGGGYALGSTLNNFDLTPEFSNNFEVGGEAKFLNNRIGIDIAYFKNRVKNQIIGNRMSYATGGIIKYVNGGNLLAEGWEIQFTAAPFRSKTFSWDITVNFDKARTIIEKMPGDLPFYYDSDTWLYGNVRTQVGVGQSLGNLSGYTYNKNANGELLVSPTSGLPALANEVWAQIGDRTPDYKFGIINTINYKDIFLSFNLDIRKGGDVFNANEMMMTILGVSKRTENREDPRVVKGILQDGLENTPTPTKNTIAITPYFRSSYYSSTSSISDADYVESVNWLRMRDITLGYQFPASLIKRQKVFRSVSIYTTVTDAFLITNYSGVDPNVNGLNASNARGFGGAGIDFGAVPSPRSYSAGVKLNF